MKKTVIVALALLLLAGGVLALAEDLNRAIAKTNAKVDHITSQCVAKLERAKSQEKMDRIAAQCEAKILEEIAELAEEAEEAGVQLSYTVEDVCVVTGVGRACFDPIHVN